MNIDLPGFLGGGMVLNISHNGLWGSFGLLAKIENLNSKIYIYFLGMFTCQRNKRLVIIVICKRIGAKHLIFLCSNNEINLLSCHPCFIFFPFRSRWKKISWSALYFELMIGINRQWGRMPYLRRLCKVCSHRRWGQITDWNGFWLRAG